jgi:hypothetical protein
MKECNGTCESCDCKPINNKNKIAPKNSINENFNGIGSLFFGESWGEVFNHKT